MNDKIFKMSCSRTITVDKKGNISIRGNNFCFVIEDKFDKFKELKALYKAVELSKKRR